MGGNQANIKIICVKRVWLDLIVEFNWKTVILVWVYKKFVDKFIKDGKENDVEQTLEEFIEN